MIEMEDRTFIIIAVVLSIIWLFVMVTSAGISPEDKELRTLFDFLLIGFIIGYGLFLAYFFIQKLKTPVKEVEFCPQCGFEIEPNEPFCTTCGYIFKKDEKQQ